MRGGGRRELSEKIAVDENPLYFCLPGCLCGVQVGRGSAKTKALFHGGARLTKRN